MRKACLIVVFVGLTASLSHAGALESPAQGAYLSGIAPLYGWVCDTEVVEVELNEYLTIETGVEPPSADIYNVCGGGNFHRFSLFYFWNWLGDGVHTARALADGVEFGRATFTVTTLGEEFVWGIEAEVLVPDFPAPGKTARFAWQEGTQNLELVEVESQ